MTTTLRSGPGPSRAGGADRGPAPSTSTLGLTRRRSVPHVLLGATLVVLCALAFATTALRVDPKTPVLALAGEIQAGHVLAEADLTVVRIVADAAMPVVPQSRRASMLGRSVRLPVAAGTLLSEAMLGPAAWPPSGQAVAAVKVTAGHAPASLDVGATVLVQVVPTSSVAAAASANPATTVRADATVVAVDRPDTSGARVVSLLMHDADAARVAGATGEVSLVVRAGAG